MVEHSDIRILYIEDDESLCDLFKIAIEAHGHSVDLVYNGEGGLALHTAQPYDLLVIDYQLPDISGIDIARKLLIDDPNIPIVMVTGKGSEQIAAEALTLGVYNYVIKDSEKAYLELLPNIIGSALKRSAERHAKINDDNVLSDAIEGMSEGFVYFDADDRLALVNTRIADIYPLVADVFVPGVSFEKCLRAGVERGQWGPNDDQDEEEWIQARLAYHFDPVGTNEFHTPDGRTIRVEEKKTSGGGIVGVRTDITELKEIEHKLRESQERFQDFAESTSDWVWETDADHQFSYMSDRLLQVTGGRAKDAYGKTRFEIAADPDDEKWQEHRTCLNARRPFRDFRYEYALMGDQPQWLSISGRPTFGSDGQFTGYRGTGREITGEVEAGNRAKRAEEELSRSEEQFRGAFETSAAGMALHDLKGTYLKVNQTFCDLLGYTQAEILGRNWRDFTHPEDIRSTEELDDKVVKEAIDNFVIEKRYIRKDEHVIWARVASSHLRDSDGIHFRILGQVYDISEMKRAEAALKEQTKLVELLRTTASAANMATDLFEAMGLALDDICAYNEWPVGHAYVLSAETPELLVSSGIWHLGDAERFETFRKISEQTTFAPGVGLPGRVMASGKPAWIVDVTKDENFPRAKLAEDIGVKAGFACPVLSGSKVVAVLEFFAPEAIEADDNLLKTLVDAGIQLGRVAERERAEEELRNSKETMYAFADNLPELFTLKDSERRFLFVNKRFEKWTDMDRHNIVGRTVHDIYPAEQAAEFDALDRQVMINQTALAREVEIHYPDGNKRTVISTRFPVISSSGETTELGTINIDITEIKRAEEALEEKSKLLRDVLENVSQGVVMFDPNKNLIAWNRHYQDVLQLPNELMVVGRPNRELAVFLAERGSLGEGDLERLTNERLDFIWSGEATRSELKIENDRIYDISSQPTSEGGLVITYTDITEIKQAEKEIETQRDALEKLNEKKDKFFSIISHDLRGPFNALLGYSSLLTSMAGTAKTEQVVEFAAIVHESAERVFNLLENLLDWSRLQMGRIEFELGPVNLAELIETNLALFAPVAGAKEIQLVDQAKQPLMVIADAAMTDTILRNLINNAIKFTESGGSITVRTEANSDWAEIQITDTGVGMSPDKIGKLFKLDQKTSTAGTGGEAGTGLGLHLCKELVEKQGGQIHIESIEEKGSTFRFTLPVYRE